MFQFENRRHFLNAVKKLLRERHWAFNNDMQTYDLILKLARQIWYDATKEDDYKNYISYCTKYNILPATNQLGLDIMQAQGLEAFKDILQNADKYFDDIKLKEEFQKYHSMSVCISEISNICGVYKLFDDGTKELVYIGRSINLGTRIVASSLERRANFFSYAETKTESDSAIYEAYYITKFKPKFNKLGKFEDDPTIVLPDLKFSEILDRRDFLPKDDEE